MIRRKEQLKSAKSSFSMARAVFFPSLLSFFFLAGAVQKWGKKKQPSRLFFLLLLAAAAAVDIGCNAEKEKVAVLNMSPHDLDIKIWRDDHTKTGGQISKNAVYPEIFEIEYHPMAQLKPMLNISSSDGKQPRGLQDLSFPLFNGKKPQELRDEWMPHFARSTVTYFKSFTDGNADIELIPLWTIHSFEEVTFAVYLLHPPNGKIYATPSEHQYILGKRKHHDDSGSFEYPNMFKKAKVIEKSDVQTTNSENQQVSISKVHKNLNRSGAKVQTINFEKPNESISQNRGIKDWRIGVRSMLNDTVKVEIFSGTKRMERDIDKYDDSLHIFTTEYNIRDDSVGCKEDILDQHTLRISILDDGKET